MINTLIRSTSIFTAAFLIGCSGKAFDSLERKSENEEKFMNNNSGLNLVLDPISAAITPNDTLTLILQNTSGKEIYIPESFGIASTAWPSGKSIETHGAHIFVEIAVDDKLEFFTIFQGKYIEFPVDVEPAKFVALQSEESREFRIPVLSILAPRKDEFESLTISLIASYANFWEYSLEPRNTWKGSVYSSPQSFRLTKVE